MELGNGNGLGNVDHPTSGHTTNSLLRKVQEKKMSNKTELVIVSGRSRMIGLTLIHALAEKYHVVGFDQDDTILFHRQRPNVSVWT